MAASGAAARNAATISTRIQAMARSVARRRGLRSRPRVRTTRLILGRRAGTALTVIPFSSDRGASGPQVPIGIPRYLQGNGRSGRPPPSSGMTCCLRSVRDAIQNRQGADPIAHGGELLTAQRGTLGRDQTAPDAMLANEPVPQRKLQARTAHGARHAHRDRASRLATCCFRVHAHGEPLVGIKRGISTLRVAADLGADGTIGQLRERLPVTPHAYDLPHSAVSFGSGWVPRELRGSW